MMHKPALFLALALAACSASEPGTGQTGNETADEAGNAIVNTMDETGEALGNGIAEAGNAIVGAVEPGRYDDWTGRWIGPEGLYLDVDKAEGGGKRYTLTMHYTLDDTGTFDGIATQRGIEFTRPDGTFTLRHTDGDATGMKYLAGKQDCLTVKPGSEGYCRD